MHRDFKHHPPGEEAVKRHESVREMIDAVWTSFDILLPTGREKALVKTKLEEAMFWANAAIARFDAQ